MHAALYDVLRFWLARGVDGFRVDVMWMMVKDGQFRDNPPNPGWRDGQSSHGRLLPLYTADRHEVHEIVAAMRAVLDEPGHDKHGDKVLIGELCLLIDCLVTYHGQDGHGAHLPFNFQLLLLENWTAGAIVALIREYEAALPPGAWPNWVLGNHDRPRVASRLGAAQARVAAMLLLTLRGTPTIYMGEELGMLDTPIPPAALRDPVELREPGWGLGRDPGRTPFPWQSGPGAGFTTGEPWLPIGADVPLDRQAVDPGSMASLYRRLIALRRAHPALVAGSIGGVAAQGDVLRFERRYGGKRLLVMLNTGGAEAEADGTGGVAIASTHMDRTGQAVGACLALRPHEGVVIQPQD